MELLQTLSKNLLTYLRKVANENKRNFFLIGTVSTLLIALLTGGIFYINSTENIQEPFSETTTVRYQAHELKVEVADTLPEQQRGLMFRQSLAPGRGMLFVFPDERSRNFWMKNTYIPLDIIYLNSDKRVVKIHQDTLPNQTQITYPSEAPAKYVLETNSSWSNKVMLEVGDQLEFQITQFE